uniref:Uncharacterized protein n=1 Tax=Phlebotomus papatasi TaxID=29031 RepID=A0A1B0DQX2_PHLPP
IFHSFVCSLNHFLFSVPLSSSTFIHSFACSSIFCYLIIRLFCLPILLLINYFMRSCYILFVQLFVPLLPRSFVLQFF